MSLSMDLSEMPKVLHTSDNSTFQIKHCFILGILYRSGTNYICKLLEQHQDCIGPDCISEDFLVHYSDVLKDYTGKVYEKWNPEWQVDKKIGPPELLLRYIGNALNQFLSLQITQEKLGKPSPIQSSLKKSTSKLLLTKTPSVRCLANFFDLFPDNYLIIIVRDGRALVESGVRSFDWSYENAMRRWTTSAKAILDLKEKCKSSEKKILIVRYEDLFQDEEAELLKIFNFLDLDSNRFNFENTKSIGVIGSSDIRSQGTTMHWQANEKKKDFNPIERFRNWDKGRHDRFNWIAGDCMLKLGYKLEDTNTNQSFYVASNRFFDLVWKLRRIGLRISRKVQKVEQKL